MLVFRQSVRLKFETKVLREREKKISHLILEKTLEEEEDISSRHNMINVKFGSKTFKKG